MAEIVIQLQVCLGSFGTCFISVLKVSDSKTCSFRHALEQYVKTYVLLSLAEKEKLLVAVGLDVRSIENDGSGMKCLVSKNVKDAVAVGLHQKKNVMFWADAYVGKIFSLILGRNETPEEVEVVPTDSYLKDLEIDWITEKLYWLTTSKGNHI